VCSGERTVEPVLLRAWNTSTTASRLGRGQISATAALRPSMRAPAHSPISNGWCGARAGRLHSTPEGAQPREEATLLRHGLAWPYWCVSPPCHPRSPRDNPCCPQCVHAKVRPRGRPGSHALRRGTSATRTRSPQSLLCTVGVPVSGCAGAWTQEARRHGRGRISMNEGPAKASRLSAAAARGAPPRLGEPGRVWMVVLEPLTVRPPQTLAEESGAPVPDLPGVKSLAEKGESNGSHDISRTA